MDPLTGAIVGAAGSAAKETATSGLLRRLVGPLADEVGLSWAAGYRQHNAEKIAQKAARKAGLEGMASPGAIHARVAHRVLEDGSYVNDDVMQEYLAGLLAGSRTERGNDDRAAYYVDLIATLPAAQVRLHHAIYSALATAGQGDHYGREDFLETHALIVPLSAAAEVAEVPADVDPQDAVAEALLGLYREGLISTVGVAPSKTLGLGGAEPGVVALATPTQMGCMLALWGHAVRDADVARLPETVPCDFDPPGPDFAVWRFRG